jgi:nickel-dependent lactate racemase
LSYLATTRQGRRVYLNRSLVDADQTVVLSGRRYDTVLGFAGAEGSLFPAMSDEGTRAEFSEHGGIDAAATAAAQAAQDEATEAGWLLGVPFFVQAIEGVGDSISAIVAGSVDASVDGRRIQVEHWERKAARPADLVVATISGDPAQHTFAHLAAAMLNASRVVRAGGRVVLLTQAAPKLGPELAPLRDADEPLEALQRLQRQPTEATVPALRWAAAASHARLTLLSQLAEETVEELFAVALQKPEQVQRLLDAGGDLLFLEDAHKSSTSLAR